MDPTNGGHPAALPVALAALLLVPACASMGSHVGGGDAEGHTTPLAAPADRLWLELEGVYRDLGLPIASVEARDRVVRSGAVALEDGGLLRVPERRVVACPAPGDTAGPGSEAGATLTVTTTLRPADGATDVVSRVEAWRTAGTGPARRIECRSTGALERRIAELLRERS